MVPMGFFLALLVSAALSAMLCLHVVRQRTDVAALHFAGLTAAVSIWSAAYALELVSPGFSGKVFWAKVQYVGIASLAVLWLLFALSTTEQTPRLLQQTRRERLLFAFPALTLLMVWTNGMHGLFWSAVSVSQEGRYPLLIVEHGFWFWLHTAYAYVLLAGGTFWFTLSLRWARGVYRWQIAAHPHFW